jgi:hypothetical protein
MFVRALSALALTFVVANAQAQTVPGVDAALLEDLAVGSRLLADAGVVDAFGHVSARHPGNPNHFLMSRSLAPALVTPADIMEFDLDGARSRVEFVEAEDPAVARQVRRP